jgi:hypothetical protein
MPVIYNSKPTAAVIEPTCTDARVELEALPYQGG